MRLVDADVLRLTLEKAKRCATNDFKEYTEYEDKSFFRGKMAAYASSLTEIDVTPTISPDSLRPKGRWVVKPLDGAEGLLLPHCSECDSPHARERNFCSECGADMRGENDEPNF